MSSQPRPRRLALEGRTAVITGAAGGIGRAIAVSLAARGAHLALADVDKSGLAETAQSLDHTGVRISCHRLDVADRAAVAALPEIVRRHHPGVDILVNNAGVALGGTFLQVSEADFEWLFEINFWGVVRMTRAFLPLLGESDDAAIVNLSSLFGLIAPAGQTAYAASKFAVRGFSQSLRNELSRTRIGVTVVHPGGVATSIAKSARTPSGADETTIARDRQRTEKLLRLPPAHAGEIIVKAVERRSARVLVGNDARVAALLERIAPVQHLKLLGVR